MAGDLAAVAGGEIEADLVADSRAAKRGPGAGEHHGDAVAGAARVSAPRAGPPSAGLVLVNITATRSLAPPGSAHHARGRQVRAWCW
ncbi:hypothetical protein GCM10009687_73190 [Asanoa iriomotensis]